VNGDGCYGRKVDILIIHNDARTWQFCSPSTLINVNIYCLTWYPLQTNIMIKWLVCLFQISGQISATMRFIASPEPSGHLLWQHIKLGHDRQLPNASEYTINKVNMLKPVAFLQYNTSLSNTPGSKSTHIQSLKVNLWKLYNVGHSLIRSPHKDISCRNIIWNLETVDLEI
jgi:hypothetical protein